MVDAAAINRRLLAGLKRILPDEFILTRKEQLRPFECDGLSVYRQLPMLAVLPENTKQVRDILKLCYELKIPVVTRGAGTGLSAGAMPYGRGLLLVMSRLNRILAIDPINRTATVQPGVRNLPWPVLRPRSLIPDRLFHRRECCGECRRCALPEIRPDRPQCFTNQAADRRGRGNNPGRRRFGQCWI